MGKTGGSKSDLSIGKKGHASSSSGDFLVSSSKGSGASSKRAKQGKKPFDKKQWRIKKYSKKYKLEQWENKRKKRVLGEYYKEIKDDEPQFDVKQIYEKYGDEEDENDNNFNKDLSIQGSSSSVGNEKPARVAGRDKKNEAYKRAKSEFQRIRDEKTRKREEMEREKLERAEALKKYKAKKLEKYKKLNKKTKTGQPVMKYRMEMLLEQIQNSM